MAQIKDNKKVIASNVKRCIIPKIARPKPANKGPSKCAIWEETEIDELAIGNSWLLATWGIKLSLAGLKNDETADKKKVVKPINIGEAKS